MMNTTTTTTTQGDGGSQSKPEWREPTTFVKKLFDLVTKNAMPSVTPPIVSWTDNGTFKRDISFL